MAVRVFVSYRDVLTGTGADHNMGNIAMSLCDEVRFRADEADKALLGVKAMASGRSEQDVMREVLHEAAIRWEREYTIATRLLMREGTPAETRGNDA